MNTTVSQDFCNERHKALDNCLSQEKIKVTNQDTAMKSVQEAIVVLTAIQARHDDEIDDHEGRLRGIESISGKRWNAVITQMIQIGLAVVVGGLIGKLF